MKNKLKQSLNGELKNVCVSPDLKKRILAEAAQSRSPVRRRSFSIRPLAAAAAVVLVLGVTAGIAMLRTAHPDLNATPLSSNNQPEESWVWTSDGDGLYHWMKDCGDLSMHRIKPEDARLTGRKACSACYADGNAAAEDLVWMTQHGIVYHAVPDCSGMEDAIGVLEMEAKTLGRVPCAVCLDGDGVESTLPPRSNTPTPMPMESTWTPATPESTITPMTTQEISVTLPPQITPIPEEMMAKSTPEPTQEPFVALPTAAPTQPVDGPTTEWSTTSEEMMARPTPEPTYEPYDALPTAAPTQNVDGPTAEWSTTPEATAMVEVTYNDEGEIISVVSLPVEIAAPTEQPEEMVDLVWVTDGGRYYHADEHCSGMENAVCVTEKEALLDGKIICDVCMRRTVWTVENGTFWHYAQHCSGMENAQMRVLEPCEVIDKERCPVCAMGEISVWMTENGTFYHWDEHCSGMMNAKQVVESEALMQNKQPCPSCLPELIIGNVEDCIWMTDGGLYYHTDQHCSGMQNAHGCTVTDALSAGKAPCPTCAKQVADVWCTENGKYYHLDEHCSGMNGAHQCKGSEAAAQGKTACPTCMHAVSDVVSGSSDCVEEVHHSESTEHHSESSTHHSESEKHHN